MDPSLWLSQILFIFFLIVFSAYFSSSETALTAASKARLHKLKKKGKKGVDNVNKLRSDKNSLISSILIGNNLVNILASALATKLFLDLFGDHGVYLVTLIMTVIVVIFAEVIPKTYAINNAEKVSLFIAPLMRIVVVVCKPFVKITDLFVYFITHRKSSKKDFITDIDELRSVIEIYHHDNYLKKVDKDMLDSVLDLAETEVSSIMTHRKNMFMVDASENNREVIEKILTSPFSRIPIWQDNKDNIVGIIHIKDILKAMHYSTKDVADIDLLKLATEPWFIPETTNLRDQLFAFRKMRNHFSVVVDEYGSVMGVVTLEDILEEIVGEIKDEHDKGEQYNFKQISDNSYLVDGFATIRDFNREYDFELPEDDASTMAGLIINIAEKIPDRNENFMYKQFKFSVLEKHKNQITKIKVTYIETET